MKAKRTLLNLLLCNVCLTSFSQTDSSKTIQHFSGSASVTNNGISLIPTFSLGKPAAILLISMGGERFSIDPDIRFALDGKPWTFVFWTRYKLVNKGRMRVNTGAHLGMNFRSTTLQVNNEQTENIILRRYLAGELAPNYFVGKNISIGSYYLYSHGLDHGAVKNTHFVTLNTNFSHIRISKQFYLRAFPQAYYLYQDGNHGYFFTSSFTIAKEKFPLSVSSVINKLLQSNIQGSKDFVWNISLVYSFRRNYFPQPTIL